MRMYTLSEPSAATLRAIHKLCEATLTDITNSVGFDAANAIHSLKRCEYITVEKTVMRVVYKRGAPEHRPSNVYSITAKGRLAIDNMEYPQTRAMKKALAVAAKKQELHSMQNWVIPDRDPNVKSMVTNIGGRDVTITYGVHHGYEPYVPPKDQSRNYAPRPIKGILAS